MNGTTFQSIVNFATVDILEHCWFGDFNGERKADILWQNTSTGQRVISLMNGTTFQWAVKFGNVVDILEASLGSGDFNGDGKADILWQNTVTGQRAISLMNGTTLSIAVSIWER